MRALFAIAPALLWLSLASATSGSNAPPAPIAPPEMKPALWKLADADTTIYLFGTIHVLPKDLAWRTAVFDRALARSSTLVLEIAELDDAAKTTAQFTWLGTSPGLPPVTDRVPADRRAPLKLMIDKAGMSAEALRQYESWAVALALASSAVRDLKLSPEHGVERQLTRDFRSAKKPILGLETSAEQFGFFDVLPESAQRVFLVSLIDEQADVQASFDEMIAAWSAGDEQKIAVTFDDELALSPELVETLLRQRNRNWTAWLAKRLETPGTVMVAVGAGHLAGKDSVQSMLAARGLKVTRVQ
jgi:uncharacterized protein